VGLIKRVIRAKVKTPLKRAVRQKVTRPVRAKAQRVTSVTCGKRYAHPLAHTCVVKTDFAKRRAAAARAVKREAAKARRKAAADRRKAAAVERRRKAREKRSAPSPRPPRQVHDYRLCRDEECPRHGCKAYRDGITDCPLEHT
jgi:hypothetical protein